MSKINPITSTSLRSSLIKSFKSNSTIDTLKYNSNNLIMRDYVEKKLYFENEAYYSNTSQNFKNYLPIGRLEKPLNFTNMRGISDYAKDLHSKYPKSTWLTVSELLRPYFGYAVGNYILSNHLSNPNRKNIKIVEVGCGIGGAIDSILEYLKNFSIKDYKEVEYFGFEMTDSLCSHTENLLRENHPELYNNNQITLMNKSLYDIQDSTIFNDECFILAFNLIDSTGHDKVRFEKNFERKYISEVKEFYSTHNFNPKFKHGEDFKIFLDDFLDRNKELIKETHAVFDKNTNSYKQEYVPISDPKIKEILFYHLMPPEERGMILGPDFLKLEKNRIKQNEEWFIKLIKNIFYFSGYINNVWLPTNAINFYSTVNNIFPSHKLILLDFDFLPSKIFRCDYRGKNSPAVYSIKPDSYDSITHPSIFSNYESVKKPVNIYFPVDFELMQIMYNLITHKSASINKFKYFMKEHSMAEWCETQSGFNPLVDTHHNLSFLLTLKNL
jgi:hypothetical protein